MLQVITKLYDIRQHSSNEYNDVNLEEKCITLLNDSEDMWSFNRQDEETSTSKYIVSYRELVMAIQ